MSSAAGAGSVLFEVHPTATSGQPVTRGLGRGQVAERARQTFQDVIQQVEPAAQAILTRLRAMPQTPDEVHVEFGLDLHAEAGAFIAAAASSTANFKVAMTWRRT